MLKYHLWNLGPGYCRSARVAKLNRPCSPWEEWKQRENTKEEKWGCAGFFGLWMMTLWFHTSWRLLVEMKLRCASKNERFARCFRQFSPKICVSLQFRAIDTPIPARVFIRQKQNVPRTTRAFPNFKNM